METEIYVGNLDESVSEQDLEELFGQVGDVVADELDLSAASGQDLRVAIGDVGDVSDVQRAGPGWRAAGLAHDVRHGFRRRRSPAAMLADRRRIDRAASGTVEVHGRGA